MEQWLGQPAVRRAEARQAPEQEEHGRERLPPVVAMPCAWGGEQPLLHPRALPGGQGGSIRRLSMVCEMEGKRPSAAPESSNRKGPAVPPLQPQPRVYLVCYVGIKGGIKTNIELRVFIPNPGLFCGLLLNYLFFFRIKQELRFYSCMRELQSWRIQLERKGGTESVQVQYLISAAACLAQRCAATFASIGT